MATSVMASSSGALMPKTRRGRHAAAHSPHPPTGATATALTSEGANPTTGTAVPLPDITGLPATPNAPGSKHTQAASKRRAPDSVADTSRKRTRKAGASDAPGSISTPHAAAQQGPGPTSTQAAAGAKPSNANAKSSKKPRSHAKRGKIGAKKTAGRNIDKVVLGDLCFRTWYPSYYPKEVLGEPPAAAALSTSNTSTSTIAGTNPSTSFTASTASPAETSADGTGAKNPLAEREAAGLGAAPMLDRLYVCPCCFKYSKELVMWWEHVQVCRARNSMPGRKIYVHPRGARTEVVPAETNGRVAPGRGKKKLEDPAAGAVTRTVEDQGEWSIWQVDGEDHMLFCQNLSLFAKLFLDNKSVFFDVTGFNYFLLVHSRPSPPPSPDLLPPSPPAPAPNDRRQPRVEHHICGFFSKEKLSWDSNNLACILVFPPWQRKGLGGLLMGASYEISRMEGVMGGPEKPISELGRKGYRRFWAGEIARWLLGLDTSSPPSSSDAGSTAAGGREGEGPGEGGGCGEVVVDVMDCSRATWIAPEDCLYVLREMNVARDDGLGSPKPTPPPEQPDLPSPEDDTPESAVDDAELQGSGQPGDTAITKSRRSSTSAGTSTQTQTQDDDDDDNDARPPPELVPRVRIDKADVAAWVAAHRISLARPCVAEGFLPEFIGDMERVRAARNASSES